MAKRVGVILSGCGRRDGSDVAEAVLALLVIERAGAVAVCAAPDAEQSAIFDHLNGKPAEPPRQARVEAARIIGGPILPLSALDAAAIDALVIPGGEGAPTLLSNYADKHELCQVDPEIARLLRALLAAHKPMGFVGLSALLAARVLGPVAGVRVTLGPRGTTPSKHAAIMGADVRPATADDVIADQKARVFTTPGFLIEGAGLAVVARSMDKLVRAVVGGARDRAPAVAPVGEAGDRPIPAMVGAPPASIGRAGDRPGNTPAAAPQELSAIEPRRRPRHTRR
ncbi:MAG TPA: isoprenoid biosynthesis glyoxalase ElbB [Polyangia bacterium]|nr:isoprenoid biosynthesis glyoxalase ElbB [Polyangia bacterium]